MTKETFIPVVGYEGLYEVSDFGNVKALQKVVPHYLSGTQIVKEKLLKPCSRGGYMLVKLTKDGNPKTFSVHRLVAIAFIENRNNLPEVNHKDAVKSNNNLSNLEWCNGEYNRNHATEMGLNIILKGEKHGCSKLMEADVLKIRKMYNRTSNGRVLSKLFGVSKLAIYDIISRKTWKHI